MIAPDWPAPVNSRGRRRDGGVSFTIATTQRDSVDEIGQSPISLRCSTGRLNPSTISPTPSDILLRRSLALWSNSVALFYWTQGRPRMPGCPALAMTPDFLPRRSAVSYRQSPCSHQFPKRNRYLFVR
jgi:hypothetical protein